MEDISDAPHGLSDMTECSLSVCSSGQFLDSRAFAVSAVTMQERDIAPKSL